MRRKEEVEEGIRQRFSTLSPLFNQRQRRWWAAAEAQSLGHGGITLVSKITGISRCAIHLGLKELVAGVPSFPPERIRAPGGGRKPLTQIQPGLSAALKALVEPATRGDPQSSVCWTSKSLRRLAKELQAQGFQISYRKVADLLHEIGYSLQANRKTREGNQHPDRNAQFEHIAQEVKNFQASHQPVISVDAKKKN